MSGIVITNNIDELTELGENWIEGKIDDSTFIKKFTDIPSMCRNSHMEELPSSVSLESLFKKYNFEKIYEDDSIFGGKEFHMWYDSDINDLKNKIISENRDKSIIDISK